MGFLEAAQIAAYGAKAIDTVAGMFGSGDRRSGISDYEMQMTNDQWRYYKAQVAHQQAREWGNDMWARSAWEQGHRLAQNTLAQQRQQWNHEFRIARDLAYNNIQRTVRDARLAGIHPLYAIGSGGSFSGIGSVGGASSPGVPAGSVSSAGAPPPIPVSGNGMLDGRSRISTSITEMLNLVNSAMDLRDRQSQRTLNAKVADAQALRDRAAAYRDFKAAQGEVTRQSNNSVAAMDSQVGMTPRHSTQPGNGSLTPEPMYRRSENGRRQVSVDGGTTWHHAKESPEELQSNVGEIRAVIAELRDLWHDVTDASPNPRRRARTVPNIDIGPQP